MKVEIQDTTREGVESVKRNIEGLNDPKALDRLVRAVEAVEEKFSGLSARIGNLEGPEFTKLLADLTIIEKRFAAIRRLAENRMELPLTDVLASLEGQLANLQSTARSLFGEIESRARETSESLDDLTRPRRVEIDTSALDAAQARIAEIMRGSERSPEGRIQLDGSSVESAIRSLQKLREDLSQGFTGEVELSSNISTRSTISRMFDVRAEYRITTV